MPVGGDMVGGIAANTIQSAMINAGINYVQEDAFSDPSNAMESLVSIKFFHVSSGYEVAFKATLEDFSDEYKPEWTEEKVYGRMDPISIFQNTSREISFSWKLAAATTEEAVGNLDKLSLLINMLYPTYTAANSETNSPKTLSTAPLMRIKLNNWVRASRPTDLNFNPVENSLTANTFGLLGKVRGITFKPDLEYGVVFIGGLMFPKIINLSCNFGVLHEHTVGWDSSSRKFSSLGFPYGSTQFVEDANGRKQIIPPNKDASVTSDKSNTNSDKKEHGALGTTAAKISVILQS